MSNSSVYAQTILNFSDQVVIISNAIILTMGVIGNMLNVLIFTGLKMFRGNQSVFYIVFASFIDCSVLFIAYLPRIQYRAFDYDLARISIVWCKARSMILHMSLMISLTTVCFSSIDQYLSTNHRYDLRQISTLKLAQRLILINICFWMMGNIPFAVFVQIEPSMGCVIINKSFQFYYFYVYLLVLNGFLPLITTAVFSAMSYQNVRRIIRRQIPIVRRRLDQQLTAMVLARVLFLLVASVPFGLQLLYSANASKDMNNSVRIAIDQLIIDITSTLFYLNYAVSYLFIG